MSRVGRHERGLHGLGVANLADQDHVGVLAKDVLQALGEGGRVQAHLALGNGALLVPVEKLHRVFDRDHVLRDRPVHGVDHGRERRGLAASHGAAHEHEPAGARRDFLDGPRQIQLLEGRDRRRHLAKHHRDGAALLVEVGPEAREARHPEGEVHLPRVLEGLLLLRRQDLIDDRLEVRLTGSRLVQRDQGPVLARGGLGAHLDVKVGSLDLHHLLQHSLDVHPHSPRTGYAAVSDSTRNSVCPYSTG